MNLLVLCADTFRADYLGCYGNSWIQTPNLDQLAAEGVRFSEFYGEALPTLPARRVLYTGRTALPFEYRKQRGDQVQLPGWHPLEDDDITFAEWLGERGYLTGLISDVYHMMKPGKNFQRGFDSWQWIRGQEVDPLIPLPKNGLAKDFNHKQYVANRSWWQSERDHYAAQVMQAAIHWLNNYGKNQPWMLWVESFDPHEPWDAPDEFIKPYAPAGDSQNLLWAPPFTSGCTPEQFEWIKANYAGECSHVDAWCGRIFQTLASLGLQDDTIIVFLSDHGTLLGEQGQIHKGDTRLRIQATRCPLIVRHPDRRHAGKQVDGFVQHQDLMPTLLNLLAEPIPDRCNGKDFWTLLDSDAKTILHDKIVTAFGWYTSVRTADWNYQAPWGNAYGHPKSKPPELYDRRHDPQELVNVIDKYPQVALELQIFLQETLGRTVNHGEALETDTPAALPGVKW